jgi:hypothetical protein
VTDFIEGLAGMMVASGIGTSGQSNGLYATSGVSVQYDFRRHFDDVEIYVIFQGVGGVPGERGQSERPVFNVWVDGHTLSGVRGTAREVFDFLHERVAFTVSGHDVLYVRGLALPQPIPIGPAPDDPTRYQYSVNFEAFLRKAGNH